MKSYIIQTALLSLIITNCLGQIVLPGIGTIGGPRPSASPRGAPVPAPSSSPETPSENPIAPPAVSPAGPTPTNRPASSPPVQASPVQPIGNPSPSPTNPSRPMSPSSASSPSPVVLAASNNANQQDSGMFTNPSRIAPATPSPSASSTNANSSSSSSSSSPAWRVPLIVVGSILGFVLILAVGAYVYNNFIKPEDTDDLLGTMPFRKATAMSKKTASPGFAEYPTTGRSNGIGYVQHSGNNASVNAVAPASLTSIPSSMGAYAAPVSAPQIPVLGYETATAAAYPYDQGSVQHIAVTSSSDLNGYYVADQNYDHSQYVDSNGYQYSEQGVYGYYDAQGNYYQHHPQPQQQPHSPH